jgi:type VI protein secretion system component Hcp
MESLCRLRLAGIPGTETNRVYRDWIRLISFNQSVVGGQHAGSAGGAIDCMLNKEIDASTPLLVKAAGEGTRFPEAVIEISGGPDQPRIEIRLSDVGLETWNLATGGSGEGPAAFESFNLRAQQAEWIVHPPEGAPVRSAWDPQHGPLAGKAGAWT